MDIELMPQPGISQTNYSIGKAGKRGSNPALRLCKVREAEGINIRRGKPCTGAVVTIDNLSARLQNAILKIWCRKAYISQA